MDVITLPNDRQFLFAQKSEACNVIFMFHGWGQTVFDKGWHLPGKWKAPFPEFCHIHEQNVNVVYLQAAGRLRNWQPVDDVDYFLQSRYWVLNKMNRTYNSVYIGGFSRGCAMVDYLLSKYGSLFSGAIRHSYPLDMSNIYTKGVSSKPVIKNPVLVVNGNGDMIERKLLQGSKDAYNFYKKNDYDTDFVLIENQGHVWSIDKNKFFLEWLDKNRRSTIMG